MKRIGLAFVVLAFSSCLLGPGQLSVACAQDSVADVSTTEEADLSNDPSVLQIASADGIQAKSAYLFAHRYAVGHTTQLLDVVGTRGETRLVSVHLWYPARGFEECENAGNSGGQGDDQACSATASVYSSRLYGITLLPQWDPLSWTIGSTESFENLPISEAHRSFPVIVFSHGNQNNAIDYVYTLEDLASFGFIVAAPDHVNNTQDDVRIDFINTTANQTVIPCFDGHPWSLSSPCSLPTPAGVPKSMTDRVHDISVVIDNLPEWFGDRADISRVGVMGHSRGTVAALAAAGGSTTWGFKADPRVKAIMGLAIGAQSITFGANVSAITVPALLLAGTLDVTGPATVSQAAFNQLGSTEKACVLIKNAKHRHFDSGLCAETQSSGTKSLGAISEANTRAILDLQTSCTLLGSPPPKCTNVNYGPSGVPMEFCGLDTFTTPSNIEPLVTSLTKSQYPPAGFDFTSTSVPTTGLTSDEVKDEVVKLAVIFFGHVLERDGDDNASFTDLLPPSVQDPTFTGCKLLTQVP